KMDLHVVAITLTHGILDKEPVLVTRGDAVRRDERYLRPRLPSDFKRGGIVIDGPATLLVRDAQDLVHTLVLDRDMAVRVVHPDLRLFIVRFIAILDGPRRLSL